MINNKGVLAIIPARGGSKGVPRKNIRLLAGKPLIAYTIEAAYECKCIDLVVVSSEDDEILKVAENFGAKAIKRPNRLASDESLSIDTVLHVLSMFDQYEIVILLQPTSPLRSIDDILGALRVFIDSEATSCISVAETPISPLRSFEILPNGRLQRIIDLEVPNRRQDAPIFYVANGAIYISNKKWLKESRKFLTADTVGYVMPALRSLDIDAEYELDFCEFIVEKYGMKFIANLI
jgi:CMP-N-acetylneuraminic acid synthetase